MSSERTVERVLTSPEETAEFGRQLGAILTAGDTVLLYGPIGAGKTHLARALIQSRLAAIGQIEDVPSPTFTLVQVYDIGAFEIWHADLYRLTSPDEVIELGLDDAFKEALVLVEWPDRLGSLVPETALRLSLSGNDDARNLTASWDDPRLADLGTP